MEVILTATKDQGIFAHNLQTGAPVRRFRDSVTHGRGFCLVGSDSAVLAAVQIQKGLLHFWHWSKDIPYYRISLPERCTSSCFSSDGALFFAGGVSGKVYVWHLCSGKLLRCLDAHYKAVTSLTLTEDDAVLISSGEDALVKCYAVGPMLTSVGSGVSDGGLLHTLSGHSLSVTSTAVSRGGINGILATCGLDRAVKVWNLANGSLVRTFALPSAINDISVSVDGEIVVAAGADGKVYKLDIRESASGSGNVSNDVNNNTYVGHRGPIQTVQLSADNRTLVSCCALDGVRIWDLHSRQCLRQLEGCFQKAQLTGAKIICQSTTPRPMPELKPLQRVLASGMAAEDKIGSLPTFVRRETPSTTSSRLEEIESVLSCAERSHESGKENRELKKRVKELESLQARWAQATFSLCESVKNNEICVDSDVAEIGVQTLITKKEGGAVSVSKEASKPVVSSQDLKKVVKKQEVEEEEEIDEEEEGEGEDLDEDEGEDEEEDEEVDEDEVDEEEEEEDDDGQENDEEEEAEDDEEEEDEDEQEEEEDEDEEEQNEDEDDESEDEEGDEQFDNLTSDQKEELFKAMAAQGIDLSGIQDEDADEDADEEEDEDEDDEEDEEDSESESDATQQPKSKSSTPTKTGDKVSTRLPTPQVGQKRPAAAVSSKHANKKRR